MITLYSAPLSLFARKVEIDAMLARIKYLAPAARDEMVARIARRSGAAMPGMLMMRSAQVLELRRAGMGIGAHTSTHPILARVSAAQAREEIAAFARDDDHAISRRRLTRSRPRRPSAPAAPGQCPPRRLRGERRCRPSPR